MIIDEAIAAIHKHSPWVHPKIVKRVHAASMQAKRLVLDEDSSILIGKFMDGCLDLIIQNRQFAMPLYDVMYVEYDTKAMYFALGGTASGPVKLLSPEADTRVGFLLDHRTVYTVASGPMSVCLMPTFNYINPRGSYHAPNYGVEFPAYDLQQVTVGTSLHGVVSNPATKLSLMFGQQILRDEFYNDGMFVPDLISLHNEVQYYWGGNIMPEKVKVDGHQRALTEIVGDVRNLYAILLWLNSLPHTVKYVSQPAGHKLYRGKRLALSAHNVVTIHMKGSVQIRHAFEKHFKNREHPRLHDVRGFWRHHGGQAQGCGHNWPPVPDKRHKFVCSKCGRERWWVHAHERGDASKGRITKEYKTEI